MASQKYRKAQRSPKRVFPFVKAGLCVSVMLAVGIGFNVASAGAGSTTVSTFGLEQTSEFIEATESQSDTNTAEWGTEESSVLTKSTNRDISQAVDEMLAAEEEERRIAEEARLAAEAAEKARVEALQSRSSSSTAAAGISSVDWSVGHDAFVEHWSARIDAYLSGSPLSGQGTTFAEAAWANGLDPRLSPAISNTESSKGAVCFLPYNAWGWGQSSWGSWESAIWGHASGLAAGGYGPMVTYAGAKRYCPPTYDSWYKNTMSEVARI